MENNRYVSITTDTPKMLKNYSADSSNRNELNVHTLCLHVRFEIVMGFDLFVGFSFDRVTCELLLFGHAGLDMVMTG